MATQSHSEPETRRLERLWAGGFGDEYLLRNRRAGIGRQAFWDGLLDRYPVGRVLEVGCNAGANLQWVVRHVDPSETYGIDVSERALTVLRRRLPGVNVIRGAARELPFRDRWFDLSYTSGVLIHQPESTLPLVMSEVVRVARRLVLAVEYFSPQTVEIPYRGVSGALFKRDYGRLYRELFPELRLVDEGFLGKAQGWDDVTWWLFDRGGTNGALRADSA